MKTADGKEYYGLRLELEQFRKDINEAVESFRKVGENAVQEGNRIDNAFNKLGQKVASVFAIGLLVQFERRIISVRGEMEALQISFETLAGERVGKQLYEDIKQFATTTPMMVKDLASGAQTLLGFNIEASKVMPILRQIGDISMGDAQKFNSLTLAFAQASATGKLLTQDQKQMVNAGFNPLQFMVEKTGKSMKELSDLMSNGEITIEMMEDAFRAATSEGGKFYGMLEKQSKGIKGALSNLQGAWEDMLNDIGTQQQSVLVQGVNLATEAVKHYEEFAKVLVSVIAAYGSYKAVLLAVAAAQKAATFWENIRLVMMFRKELGLATAAQQAFNIAFKASPWGLALGAITGIVTAITLFSRGTDKATESTQKLNKAFNDTLAEIASENKNIDSLFDKLRKAEKGTDEYRKTKEAIIDQYGKYLNGLGEEIRTLKDVEGAYKAVTRAAREASLARGREAALRDAQDTYNSTYSDRLGKIYDALSKKTSKENATAYLKQIQTELRNTGTISEQTEAKIKEVFKGTSNFGNAGAWFNTLRRNEKEFSDATKRADELFNSEEAQADKTTKKVVSLNEAYTAAEKAYEKADQKLKTMRKNRNAYTKEQWDEAVKAREAAEKAYKDLGGDPDGKLSRAAAKQESEEAKNIKQQQEYLRLQKDLARERTRQEHDLWSETEQATINAMQDGSQKNIRQIELDFENRKEALRRQYEDLRQAKFEEDKRLWESNPANKNKPFTGKVTDSTYDITVAEQKMLQAQEDAAAIEHSRRLREQNDADRQALVDYLKEYGTFQQQKLAIALEYAEKIRKANAQGDALGAITARRQQSAAEASAQAENLRKGIDWTTVFSDFGIILRDQLSATLRDMREFTTKDEFKAMSPESQQAFIRALNETERQYGTSKLNDINIGKVGTLLDTFVDKQNALTAAQDAAEQQSQKTLQAYEKWQDALEHGTKETQDAAKAEYDKQLNNQGIADTQVQKASAEAAKAQNDVTEAATKTYNALNGLAEGLQGFTSGSLQGAWQAFATLDEKLNGGKIAESLGKAFGANGNFVMQIIGAVLSILDILKEGIGTIISSLIDTILQAVNGILKNILTGEFIKQIGTSLYEGITGILDTITFGGLSSLFGANGNAKEVNKLVDRLTASNEALQKAIDHLRERMEDRGGDQATEIYKEALDAMKQQSENNRAMLEARMGYHAAHRSNNYYLDESLTADDFKRMEAIIKRNTGHDVKLRAASDLWKLTSEELAQLQELDDIWTKIMTGGKYDNTEWLDNYIDDYKEINELQDAWRESITATSFDGVRTSFNNLLLDYRKGTKDAIASVDDMFKQAITRSLSSGDYFDESEKWYEKFADYMQDGLESWEADELRKWYQNLYDRMASDRDKAYSAAGINPNEAVDQSSTKKGFATASQDSIDELNGRFAGLMMIEEQSRGILETSAADIAIIREFQSQSVSISQEIRNLSVLMVSHLEDISKYTKHLVAIDENVQYFKTKIN